LQLVQPHAVFNSEGWKSDVAYLKVSKHSVVRKSHSLTVPSAEPVRMLPPLSFV
jgi:hypothetical protein